MLQVGNRYQISIQRRFHHTTYGPKGSCIATCLYQQICIKSLGQPSQIALFPGVFWSAWLVMSTGRSRRWNFKWFFFFTFPMYECFFVVNRWWFHRVCWFFPVKQLGDMIQFDLGTCFFFQWGVAKKYQLILFLLCFLNCVLPLRMLLPLLMLMMPMCSPTGACSDRNGAVFLLGHWSIN